nr:DUF4340 domain-containing protein [uncultured Cellulosilyticum sp.]
MKRKGWLIPIIVFVVSFVSLIFYQKRQDINTFADTTNMTPILWSESVADITKVVYKHSGQQLVASREGDNWFITEPIKAEGDALYIYNVISAFKEPLFEEMIEVSPTNPTSYGIDELSSSITLYDNEGHEYVLIKGNPANSLNDYVYSPLSDTVYTMPQTTFNTIKSDINSWRNKELLSFNRNNVKEIILTLGGQNYTLLPEEVGTAPQTQIFFTAQNLNPTNTNSFVSYLETSKIEKFITDTPDSVILDAYGFNKPTLKVTIKLNDGSSLGLTIGNVMKAENICYAKRDDSNSIYGITYFDLSQLKVTASNEMSTNNTTIEAKNSSTSTTTDSAIKN